MSKNRKYWIIGIAAASALSLLGVGAYAYGGHGFGHRGAIMRRIASAHIDEALDAARATPEQRQKVHAAKERVFQTLADTHRDRGAHLDEALRLFTADRLDRDRIAALRRDRQAEMQRVGDAIEQAIVEVHGTLNPQQRRAVADHIAQHRRNR